MNKGLFFKMSLATLSVLALFSQPVLAEENIHFSSCKEAWANGYSDLLQKMPGKELTTLNQTVKWHKVSGFMILLIKPGIT